MTATRADEASPAACCVPLAASGLSGDEAAALAGAFAALGSPHRVRIVHLLLSAPEPVCVCDLTPQLGLAQPTVSHHLKRLVDAGLLRRERRGTWAHYSVEPAVLDRLSDALRPEGATR